MKKVAYIRTSTGKQTLGIEVQKEALKAYFPTHWFIEWNGNSFFDKFYKVQNFFPYAIPIVLDNEPPRM
ncbi:MAG: hypothetical protein WAX08_01435 [Streptococcus suis]